MKPKTLGEFGRFGGQTVVTVRLVRGHSAEIRKLWKALDSADATGQDAIFRRLDEIGSLSTTAAPATVAGAR
jgi:hypothetical protein